MPSSPDIRGPCFTSEGYTPGHPGHCSSLSRLNEDTGFLRGTGAYSLSVFGLKGSQIVTAVCVKGGSRTLSETLVFLRLTSHLKILFITDMGPTHGWFILHPPEKSLETTQAACSHSHSCTVSQGFPGGSVVKNLPANAGDVVRSLEEDMATPSSILAWRTPWDHKESDTTEHTCIFHENL